jgi:cysteinyl-tRNA synthetase
MHGLSNLRKAIVDLQAPPDAHVSTSTIASILEPFWTAVYDDLNMPQALAAVWEIVHASSFSVSEKKCAIAQADTILALDLLSTVSKEVMLPDPGSDTTIRFVSDKPLSDKEMEEIRAMVVARNRERKNRNFSVADRLRDELLAHGVVIKDLKDGSAECTIQGVL